MRRRWLRQPECVAQIARRFDRRLGLRATRPWRTGRLGLRGTRSWRIYRRWLSAPRRYRCPAGEQPCQQHTATSHGVDPITSPSLRRCRDQVVTIVTVIVIVIVDVIVILPVIVAVHVHGNDTVIVIGSP